ncbi:MAG TPA: aminotransferase class V-fold PLP-dependent enzyme [Thermoproteota archaeon]|nr:aminotransferase class V-fold PLP-dependent enzyme [Thermoproteota archaeon]
MSKQASTEKIPFDNVDYPPIPRQLLSSLSDSTDGRRQSPWRTADVDHRRELGRLFGFVLETEISVFRTVWQVAQWLTLNLKAERRASVAFPCFEPEAFVVPFVNSLKGRGFIPQLIPVDTNFDPRFDLFPQVSKGGPMLFLFSLVGPITGRIAKTAEVVKVVHELGGLVVADATNYVQRIAPALGSVDADLIVIRSRPLLAPDGVVVVYLSRRMRETLKQDADAAASWRNMNALDAPIELVPSLVESLKFLSSVADRRRVELERNKTILDGLKGIEEIRILGPTEAGERAAIFALEVKGLEASEVALLMDSSEDLLVSYGKPGMGSSKLCPVYPDRAAIRASPFVNNNASDVEGFVEAMRQISVSLR